MKNWHVVAILAAIIYFVPQKAARRTLVFGFILAIFFVVPGCGGSAA